MRRFLWLTAVLVSMFFISGCGYHVGSLMHPQIHSIAIAPVVNETVLFNVSSSLRSMLSETFMVDGSLKLTDMKRADCILYARVLNATFREVTEKSTSKRTSSNTNHITPMSWAVDLTVEYSVIIPGRAKPLVENASVKGTAEFNISTDMQTARENGVRQAAYQAAKNITSQVTEAW